MLQQEKNLDKMLLPWHLSKHQAKAPTVCTTVTMSPWQREGYVRSPLPCEILERHLPPSTGAL